jgi:hypothetical protein
MHPILTVGDRRPESELIQESLQAKKDVWIFSFFYVLVAFLCSFGKDPVVTGNCHTFNGIFVTPSIQSFSSNLNATPRYL